MYWLSQEDPIYQYNLMKASFCALDELFGSKEKKSPSRDGENQKGYTGNEKNSKHNGRTNSPGFLGRIWDLIPSKV